MAALYICRRCGDVMDDFFSPLFENEIWPMFAKTLNTPKSKSDYYAILKDICHYLKKDFLSLGEADAQSYFNHLLMLRNSGKQSLKTIRVKLARLKSVSNFVLRHSYLFELQQSYLHNPFQKVSLPQGEEFLTAKNVPDIDDLNTILHKAESDPQLYLILSLMIRCALSAGEICILKYEDFVQDQNGNVGIEYCFRNTKRYVKLPSDVLTMIQEFIGDSEVAQSAYLFHNKRGNPLRIRDLERLYLKYVPSEESPHFTLSDIRNGSTAYMLLCGAAPAEVARYIGIAPEWMRRFDKVIPELYVAAVDYTNIQVRPLSEISRKNDNSAS